MPKFDLSWPEQESPEFRAFAKSLNAPKLRAPDAEGSRVKTSPPPLPDGLSVQAKGNVGPRGDTRGKVVVSKTFGAPKTADDDDDDN
jgi:hypothetical protein